MPLCDFKTNLPNDKIPESFEKEFSQLLSEVLAKPIERISVNLMPGQRLVRGGTNEPNCWINLWSINVFSKEKNPVYASKLHPFIKQQLGINADRIVILCNDITADQVAKPC